MILPPDAPAKSQLPVRVVEPAVAAVERPIGAHQAFSEPLAEPGSEQRWRQLQQLRRGSGPLHGLLTALNGSDLEPEPDLLAALVPRLDRAGVEALLAGPVGVDPGPLLAAALAEWSALATQPAFATAWLEPLLHHCDAAPQLWQQLGWLQLVGQFRDPRVAHALRARLAQAAAEQGALLLPLLGHQRCAVDAELLLRLALDPGPLQLRRQALEAVAVGLTAWPREPLIEALSTLVSDLDPGLAGKAVDLLARLPEGSPNLRPLLNHQLDRAVRARLQRRLCCAPLVLVVHGRQGGVIPSDLQQLAQELAALRGSPVLLQALTGDRPEPDGKFWEAARRAGRCGLLPLLLLPGGHVRSDVPRLARGWRELAADHGVRLQRWPFVGAWPSWQHQLALQLDHEAAAVPRRHLLWLHHPLEGPLAARYLRHLGARLRAPGHRAPFSAPLAGLEKLLGSGDCLLQPLTLSANRLSESLAAAVGDCDAEEDRPIVLPPLLEQPALRGVLLRALTLLP